MNTGSAWWARADAADRGRRPARGRGLRRPRRRSDGSRRARCHVRGSAQYATVSVLSGGGTLGAALLAAAALNVRYIAMSAAVPAVGAGGEPAPACCSRTRPGAWPPARAPG